MGLAESTKKKSLSDTHSEIHDISLGHPGEPQAWENTVSWSIWLGFGNRNLGELLASLLFTA